MKTMKTRRKQMSQAQVERLRAGIIDIIGRGPVTCPMLAKQHGMISRTMMNHLMFMKNLGLIHSRKVELGSRAPYTWFLGPGESVVRRKASSLEVKEMPTVQKRVTSWPAVQMPKQGIFAALGI